jgi:hypothetical protein
VINPEVRREVGAFKGAECCREEVSIHMMGITVLRWEVRKGCAEFSDNWNLKIIFFGF